MQGGTKWAFVAVALSLMVCMAVADNWYYIAAVEEVWDYAPGDVNPLTGLPWSDVEATWVVADETRLGSKYFKARYVAFTNDTFTERVPTPPEWAHLGVLGPVIRGRAADRIHIVFRNMASFSLNMWPRSVVSEEPLKPQAVAPGQTEVLRWSVPVEAGPGEQGPRSTLATYGSTVDPHAHTAAGLLGAIIIVADDGSHDVDLRPLDVDVEYVVLMNMFSESVSPLLNRTIAAFAQEPGALAVHSEAFAESNRMHSLNGYMFGTAPPGSRWEGARVGDRIRWYIFSYGDHAALHSMHWHANAVRPENGLSAADAERAVAAVDVLPSLYSGEIRTADMVADTPGRWLMHCHVDDHVRGGMIATYTVGNSSAWEPPLLSPVATRTYFIAAEYVLWDYAPTGANADAEGRAWTPEEARYMTASSARIGRSYWKAVYRAYTDATFTAPLQAEGDRFLGLLGPTIRAIVGDEVHIVFRNRVNFTCSMHVHGLQYEKRDEGALYEDDTPPEWRRDDAVPPGGEYTYVWRAVERSGPPESSAVSSVTWMYHSHTVEVADVATGLVGHVVVARRAQADPITAVATDVDREFIVSAVVFDENNSHALQRNVDDFTTSDAIDTSDPDWVESNIMRTINGFMYGHMAFPSVEPGELVRLHIGSIGGPELPHAIGWQGQWATLGGGEVRAVVSLFGAQTQSVDVRVASASRGVQRIAGLAYPDGVGGMSARVRVANTSSRVQRRSSDGDVSGVDNGVDNDDGDANGAQSSAVNSVNDEAHTDVHTKQRQRQRQRQRQQQQRVGTERVFYLATREVEWDYCPSFPHNNVTQSSLTTEQRRYLETSTDTIGRKYQKWIFEEYTSDSFTQRREPRAWQGLQGPPLHACAGDSLTILLNNTLPDAVRMHIQGSINSDTGTPFAPSVSASDGVTRLHWDVIGSPDMGAANALSSHAWIYSSKRDGVHVGHEAAGLFGAVVVSRSDACDAETGAGPTDVVDTFVVWTQDVDENKSPLLTTNVNTYGDGVAIDVTSDHFNRTNRRASVNGWQWGSLGVVMYQGDLYRWHFLSLDPNGLPHQMHLHQSFARHNGLVVDHVSTTYGSSVAVDIDASATGLQVLSSLMWSDQAYGMAVSYEVTIPPREPDVPKDSSSVTLTVLVVLGVVALVALTVGALLVYRSRHRSEPSMAYAFDKDIVEMDSFGGGDDDKSMSEVTIEEEEG